MAESSKALMQVNIVAADHPVWHGTAKSVTIPASEGEMGILADHEPVLTVIKGGTVSVVDPAGERHAFEVSDGFISFDFNKLTVAVERGRDVVRTGDFTRGIAQSGDFNPYFGVRYARAVGAAVRFVPVTGPRGAPSLPRVLYTGVTCALLLLIALLNIPVASVRRFLPRSAFCS